MLTTAQSAKNKSVYYAIQLHEAMAGMGTKDDDLIRLLVTRSEVFISFDIDPH